MLIANNQSMIWDSNVRDFKPGDVGQFKVLLVDFVNLTNVLDEVVSLSRNVIGGKVYSFKSNLWVTDDGEGLQIDFGGTATMDWFRATYKGFDDTLSLVKQSLALGTLLESDGFSGVIEIKGSFEPSASGTFVIRVAQKNHAVGELTVLKGSSISVQETL